MAYDKLKPPWEERGVTIKPENTNGGQWKSTWPEIDQSIDPVQAAADFYLLEALSTGYVFPLPVRLKPYRVNTDNDNTFFKKFGVKTAKDKQKMLKLRDDRILARIDDDPTFAVRMLMGEAAVMLADLTEKLDTTFYHYGHMACAGELRHHPCVGGNKVLSSSRSHAWCGWREIHTTLGPQALLDAADLFYDFGRGKVAYGGKKWAVCAETVHAREIGTLGPDGPDGVINKRMFIDRMFTLEHNGGSFLNKINWGMMNSRGWGLGGMKRVLDAHASNPTNWRLLLAVCSAGVRKQFDQMLQETSRALVSMGHEPLTMDEFANKIFRVCRWCGSNPDLGHKLRCNAIHLGKVAAGGEGYINNLDFDSNIPDGYSLPVEKLAFDHQGIANPKFVENAEIKVKLSIVASWEVPGQAWHNTSKHSATKTASLSDYEKKLVMKWDNYGSSKRKLGYKLVKASVLFKLLVNDEVADVVKKNYSEELGTSFEEDINLYDLFGEAKYAVMLGLFNKENK